jgi:hypothetical protein
LQLRWRLAGLVEYVREAGFDGDDGIAKLDRGFLLQQSGSAAVKHAVQHIATA